MKVLGLDVSTSNVGVCVIDTSLPMEDRVVVAEGISMTKVKGLYTKSVMLREHLVDVAYDHEIDVIVVEEALQAFRSRMSSAGTLAKLNRFNGIASYLARSIFDCPLYLANVISTRKAVGFIVNRKAELKTKDQVFEWVKVQPDMISYPWPTKVLKSGKNKGVTRNEAVCFDIADAYVVARFGADVLKTTDISDTNV